MTLQFVCVCFEPVVNELWFKPGLEDQAAKSLVGGDWILGQGNVANRRTGCKQDRFGGQQASGTARQALLGKVSHPTAHPPLAHACKILGGQPRDIAVEVRGIDRRGRATTHYVGDVPDAEFPPLTRHTQAPSRWRPPPRPAART